MKYIFVVSLLVCTFVCVLSRDVATQSLRGSARSLDRQNLWARQHDFTFLRNSTQLRRFVGAGLLVPVSGNRNYILHEVSFPYARPEARLFIERLSGQYRSSCGERLVVTSLTRPQSHQPSNASPRSVHPTGMALDLRRPRQSICRQWLERVLLSLEGQRVLEVTTEQRPPHFHVAIFPKAYSAYVARLLSHVPDWSASYTVRRHDTLWRIARNHGTTPAAIRRENRLLSTMIHPGQRLKLPVD